MEDDAIQSTPADERDHIEVDIDSIIEDTAARSVLLFASLTGNADIISTTVRRMSSVGTRREEHPKASLAKKGLLSADLNFGKDSSKLMELQRRTQKMEADSAAKGPAGGKFGVQPKKAEPEPAKAPSIEFSRGRELLAKERDRERDEGSNRDKDREKMREREREKLKEQQEKEKEKEKEKEREREREREKEREKEKPKEKESLTASTDSMSKREKDREREREKRKERELGKRAQR